MKREQLAADFPWYRMSSSKTDIKRLGKRNAARIIFQMHLINSFENELLRLKDNGCVWGPVHTSVGQEAVAAASLSALRSADKVTASHRAHHQFLSKVFNYTVEESWDPVSQELPERTQNIVNRAMAEIMGLKPGFCGGRGGSMHLRWEEAGFLGSNAIVAGGIPLATGAAFAEQKLGSDNVVVSFFGDGAVNQGAFHEALNLAGLWKLPLICLIENNEFAVGTRNEDASAVPELSLRALSYGMEGFVVDGRDVAAVYRVMEEVADGIRTGRPPAIIEVKCWRHYHHAGATPGSAYGYRDKEEEQRYAENDPLNTFPRVLQENAILSENEVGVLKRAANDSVRQAVDFCTITTDAGCSVREELWPDETTAAFGLRSEGTELESLPYAEREDFAEFRSLKYSDAIATAAGTWMERDETVYVLGEEVANFGGGAYGATKGLPRRYPGRIVNTPISEGGFTGLGCGAAMNGLRMIVEIMFADFALVAADQLFNQIAKARHMYGGTTDLPLVVRVRIATGLGYGGQHSMDPVALFGLFPGWRIVAPSNSFDYIGLFNTAMHSTDPVVFLEHHSLYGTAFDVPKEDLDYCVPLGHARVVQPGDDITVLTYASMSGRVQALSEALAARGVSAEIIDLRTVDLLGIDYDTIGASLSKTGVVGIVEEAAGSQTIGPRIAEQITTRFFDLLDAPVGCLSSLDVPTSVSRKLEAAALISDEEITEGLSAMAKRAWR